MRKQCKGGSHACVVVGSGGGSWGWISSVRSACVGFEGYVGRVYSDDAGRIGMGGSENWRGAVWCCGFTIVTRSDGSVGN